MLNCRKQKQPVPNGGSNSVPTHVLMQGDGSLKIASISLERSRDLAITIERLLPLSKRQKPSTLQIASKNPKEI